MTRTRKSIITELENIEAIAPPCLPNPECTCPICEHYCELWGMLDEINEKPKRAKRFKT